jgi:hypothetical protein
MSSTVIHQLLSFMLLFVVGSVSAFDAGDTIALILGLAIGNFYSFK